MRRQAYAADVTYVTNKELTFDYLKDRIATGQGQGGARHALSVALGGAVPDGLILRGLHVALVDEADSVLIDEARTPLVISAERHDEDLTAIIGRALEVAQGLAVGQDFLLDETRRRVLLTPGGRNAVAERLGGGSGLFRARTAREQIAIQALTALHLFARDRDYIVADGKVQIVDEYTGRVMPDRSWEQGLHQLVEAKEGVDHDRRPPDPGPHHLPALLQPLPAPQRHDRHGAGSGGRAACRLRPARRAAARPTAACNGATGADACCPTPARSGRQWPTAPPRSAAKAGRCSSAPSRWRRPKRCRRCWPHAPCPTWC